MKRSLFILILFFSQFCFCADNDIPRDAEGWAVSSITVNGLRVLGKYSKEDVAKALGDDITITDTVSEEGRCIFFESKGDVITLEDGRLTRFDIRNPNGKFVINEAIRPGISVTELLKLLADLKGEIGIHDSVTNKSGRKFVTVDVVKDYDGGYINFWYSNDTVDTIILDHIE